MSDDLSNLKRLLENIAAEYNYTNPDIQINPIATAGANFSSKLYLNKIKSHGKEDLRLFAKVAAFVENMREQTVMKPFDNERFFYSELVKIYTGLEEKSNVPKEKKLSFPKFYAADATHLQEIVVLEDLACQGFVLHDRTEPVSWEFAVAAITEMARSHALSIAFERNDPTRFKQVAGMFPRGMFSDHEANRKFFNSSKQSALTWVRPENRDKLKRFLENFSIATFTAGFEPLVSPVIIHADYRPSNMMWRKNDDGSVKIMVVDYQTIQSGSQMKDLLYFIFSATDGPFRAKHYQGIIDLYHAELGAALDRLGIDVETVYSRKDYERELKQKLPWGLHLSVMVLPPLLSPEAATPDLGEEFSMTLIADLPLGDKYEERLNQVVDDYVNWGVLV